MEKHVQIQGAARTGLDGSARSLTMADLDRFISTQNPDASAHAAANDLRQMIVASSSPKLDVPAPENTRKINIRGNGTDDVNHVLRLIVLGEIVVASPQEMVAELANHTRTWFLGHPVTIDTCVDMGSLPSKGFDRMSNSQKAYKSSCN